jgi:hypothetical protein
MPQNPMPICATTVEELSEMYHPRAAGYFVDLTGLIGFRTAKTTYRAEYPGSPRRIRTRMQTIVWYGFDSDAGCYVRVGASKAAQAWAQYYRLPRRRRSRR